MDGFIVIMVSLSLVTTTMVTFITVAFTFELYISIQESIASCTSGL